MTTPVSTPPTGRWIARSSFAAKASARLRVFGRDARGATAIEYALISGLIFLAIVASLNLFADRMKTMYGVIETAVTRN
ncbi:MAG TPA: Flp family type IVb pilin [Methylobacterium sp.]|jgi:pilus assembly protein Flp/PilA